MTDSDNKYELFSRDPAYFGITSDDPAHVPGQVEDHPNHASGYWYVRYKRITCSCGLTFEGAALSGGKKLNGQLLRGWRNHLESMKPLSDEVTHVGTISKPRVKWKVVVFSRAYEHADLYANGRFAPWLKGESYWAHYGWAVAVDKGKRGKTTLNVCRSKQDALNSAHGTLEKGADEGFSVEFAIDKRPQPGAMPTLRGTVLELLDSAEEALQGTIVDVQVAKEQLDEMLSLIPIIQARRDEIAAAWQDRTTGLMQASGGTQ